MQLPVIKKIRILPITIVATIALIATIGFMRVRASSTVIKKENISRKSVSSKVTVHAAHRGNPWINLTDGIDLGISYNEGAKAELSQILESDKATALSLASRDGLLGANWRLSKGPEAQARSIQNLRRIR